MCVAQQAASASSSSSVPDAPTEHEQDAAVDDPAQAFAFIQGILRGLGELFADPISNQFEKCCKVSCLRIRSHSADANRNGPTVTVFGSASIRFRLWFRFSLVSI